MNTCYFREAFNTLKASRWTLFKARWFGVKHTVQNKDMMVKTTLYKGVWYLIDFKVFKP